MPSIEILFDNTNTATVSNGASQSFIAIASAAHITEVLDYHFNNGAGDSPGTITLETPQGAPIFGPIQATGRNQGAIPNGSAVVNPTNLDLPAGIYRIRDSKPASWSQNSSSGGHGFVRVSGWYLEPVARLSKYKILEGEGPTCKRAYQDAQGKIDNYKAANPASDAISIAAVAVGPGVELDADGQPVMSSTGASGGGLLIQNWYCVFVLMRD